MSARHKIHSLILGGIFAIAGFLGLVSGSGGVFALALAGLLIAASIRGDLRMR